MTEWGITLMCLAFAAVIPPHSGDLFALSPEVSAQALVGGKPVLVERETDRPKLLDFYRANNFKSWNTCHSARDGVTYDQMLCNLGR